MLEWELGWFCSIVARDRSQGATLAPDETRILLALVHKLADAGWEHSEAGVRRLARTVLSAWGPALG